jgi:hypothetical protein
MSVEPLSNHEYSAFLTGLAHYLENPSEPARLEQSVEMIHKQIQPDFYELFEQYRGEGYSAEEAENLAWKVIQGTNAQENTNHLEKDNYYCYSCGADFSDWYSLSDEERENIIESDPEINPGNLPICCPCCGIPYDDEDDEIY